MNPEHDHAHEADPWLSRLRGLASHDLDPSRRERLRARAHAELRRRTRGDTPQLRAADVLEPLVFAGCAATVLARLALVVGMLIDAAS